MAIKFTAAPPQKETVASPRAPVSLTAGAATALSHDLTHLSDFGALSVPRIYVSATAPSPLATETASLRDARAARKPVVINGDASTPPSLAERVNRMRNRAHELLERADILAPASPHTFSTNIAAITRPTERIIAQPQDNRSIGERLAAFVVRKSDSLVASIKELHPADFVRRFKVDLGVLRDLSKSGEYEEIKSDREALTRKIHGRLVGSLVFSDTAAYLSIPVGLAVQAKTGDPYLTLAAGVISGYAIAVATFQATFGFVSKDLYQKNNPLDKEPTKKGNMLTRSWAALKNFESDLFPVHVKAFKAALACYAISLPLCSMIIESIKVLPAAVQHYTPISILEVGLSITLFEGMFLKLVSRSNEAHAKTLAAKYFQPASATSAEESQLKAAGQPQSHS